MPRLKPVKTKRTNGIALCSFCSDLTKEFLSLLFHDCAASISLENSSTAISNDFELPSTLLNGVMKKCTFNILVAHNKLYFFSSSNDPTLSISSRSESSYGMIACMNRSQK